jgi:hypothetical protein
VSIHDTRLLQDAGQALASQLPEDDDIPIAIVA